MTIHFICRGNALRSPLAEAYIKSLKIPNVTVLSSGTMANVFREANQSTIKRVHALLSDLGMGDCAKDSPEQLTAARLQGADVVVCMNEAACNEARKIVELPKETIIWQIDDIGEGKRLPGSEADLVPLTREVFEEVKGNVDQLIQSLRLNEKMKINDIEINQLTQLLKKLEPGLLPEPVFIAMSRLVVMVAIEFLVVRKTDTGVELLLIRRPADDPVWPGKWHSPGTIIRPTDTSLQSCFDRLYQDELGGIKQLKMYPVGMSYGAGDRGTGLTIEYVLDATEDDITVGQFFSLENLPENYIQEQLPMWQRAISSFM